LLIFNKYKPDYDIGFVEEKLSVEMISQAQREAAKLAEVIVVYYEERRKQHEEEWRKQIEGDEAESNVMERYYDEWREDIESISKIRVLPAVTTGLRRGDIEAMRIGDVHFDRNKLQSQEGHGGTPCS